MYFQMCLVNIYVISLRPHEIETFFVLLTKFAFEKIRMFKVCSLFSQYESSFYDIILHFSLHFMLWGKLKSIS